MEADVHGHQRKVVRWRVRPVKAGYGTEGIAVRKGRTLPFSITRGWNAPAGHYTEQWFLIEPGSREVLYESPPRELLVWGLQSVTDVIDVVDDPIALPAGTYAVVFALNGVQGGEAEVPAAEGNEDVA